MTARLHGMLADFSPWSSSEDVALKDAYLSGGIKAAVAALPARSEGAIYHRAIRLRFTRRRRWTAAHDAHLRKLWDSELDLDEIASRIDRSQITTYWRAGKIGLPLGCPDGWEYLSAAAERTGYCTGQLRVILAADGVAIRRAIAAPKRKRRGKSGVSRLTHIVHPGAVDAAVAAWLEAEPLERAANRVGVSAEKLARRLRLVGVSKTVGRKCVWRVRPEDVERAMGVAA